MSNSYDSVKSSKRPVNIKTKREVAAGASNQERGTGSGEVRMPTPTSTEHRQLGNQLRVVIADDAKSALAHYDSTLLDPVADPSDKAPKYSKPSPKRTLGKRSL